MDRPTLHDPQFAMTSDLREHINLQNAYIAYLEGKINGSIGLTGSGVPAVSEKQLHRYRGLVEAKKALLKVKGTEPASSGSFLADILGGLIVAGLDMSFEERLNKGRVRESELERIIIKLEDEIATLAAA